MARRLTARLHQVEGRNSARLFELFDDRFLRIRRQAGKGRRIEYAMDIAILAPEQRHMLPKTALVQIQQPVPMRVLLTAKAVELPGLLRIGFFEAIGKAVVDAGVFLLLRNGKSQNLPLAETFK